MCCESCGGPIRKPAFGPPPLRICAACEAMLVNATRRVRRVTVLARDIAQTLELEKWAAAL